MNYYLHRAFLLSITKGLPKCAKEREQYEMAAARKHRKHRATKGA